MISVRLIASPAISVIAVPVAVVLSIAVVSGVRVSGIAEAGATAFIVSAIVCSFTTMLALKVDPGPPTLRRHVRQSSLCYLLALVFGLAAWGGLNREPRSFETAFTVIIFVASVAAIVVNAAHGAFHRHRTTAA